LFPPNTPKNFSSGVGRLSPGRSMEPPKEVTDEGMLAGMDGEGKFWKFFKIIIKSGIIVDFAMKLQLYDRIPVHERTSFNAWIL